YALGCCKPKGPIAPSALQSVLFPFLVALFRVLFHDRASSYFFCATAVASAFLGTFLDVFVLTLLFCTDTLEMFLTRHADLHASYLQSLSHSYVRPDSMCRKASPLNDPTGTSEQVGLIACYAADLFGFADCA